MKNIVCSVVAFLFIPALCFGQSSSLLKSYKIPTYSYHSIKINSSDFLDFSRINRLGSRQSDELFNMNLNFEEFMMTQSPQKTSIVEGVLSLNYLSESQIQRYKTWNYNTNKYDSKEKKITEDLFTELLVFTSATDRYFADEKGLFYHLGLNLINIFSNKAENPYTSRYVDNRTLITYNNFPVALGFGRVIGVKNVVQAYIISDELGLSLKDDSLFKLAEIIEKYDNGFYRAKFRDDSEIQFFSDVAEVIGQEGNSPKIDQILNSPIYKTSTRYIGWDFRFGINNIFTSVQNFTTSYSDNEYEYISDLFASIDYTLPIGFDKQVIASVNYSKNLQTDDPRRTPKLGISSCFKIDHSYKWSSSLSANYNKAFFEDSDNHNRANTRISLKTDYLLLNRFSIFAIFDYNKESFFEIAGIDANNIMNNSFWLPYSVPYGQKMEYIDFHVGLNLYLK